MVGLPAPGAALDAPGRRRLILDKGNVSEANLQALTQADFSFIAAIPETWTSPFATCPVSAHHPVLVGERRRVNVMEEPQPVLNPQAIGKESSSFGKAKKLKCLIGNRKINLGEGGDHIRPLILW